VTVDISEYDISCIVRTNPGDFAIYKFENDVLRTLYYSPSLPEISAMNKQEYEELVIEDASRIVLNRDRERISGLLKKMFADKNDIDYTYRIINKNNGFAWVHAKSRLIGTLDGFPVLMTVFLNTSFESEEHASLLNNSNGIVYVLEKNTYELLYANEPALKLWGKNNYCGLECYTFICGRYEKCPWCSVPKMQNGSVHVDAAYSPLADKWFRIDCHEIKWFGHDAVAVYSIDITAEKKQQLSLQIDKISLEKTINNIPMGVAVCEMKNGKIIRSAVNPHICELLGVPQNNLHEYDRQLLNGVYKSDRDLTICEMKKFLIPNSYVKHDFRFTKNAGDTYRWLRLTARTIGNEDSIVVFSCLFDVTAEKEAEAQINKSRMMYEAAVEQAKLVVWEYDIINHKVIMFDNDFTKYDYRKFGLPKIVENAPNSLLDYISDNDAQKFLDMYKAIENGAKHASCEVWYKIKPGQELRCENISYTTVFDDEGKPFVAYGIGQNITSQKLEEKKYNKILEELIDSNPQSLGAFRINLTKNWCGDGHSQYNDVLSLEKSGTADGFFENVSKYITDDKIREIYKEQFNRQRLLNEFHGGKAQFKMEYPTTYSKGGTFWVAAYFNLVQNPNTGDIEAVTYTYNITERKKEEEIIQRVTNEKCDYIGLIDIKENTFEFRNINRNIKGLPIRHKIKYDICISYDINTYVADEDKNLFVENTAVCTLIQKLSRSIDYYFAYSHNENGYKYRKQLQYSYLNKEQKEILVIQTDITELYTQEQEQLKKLEYALHAAENANRAKSEFLSRISHDIRTPMNVISGMTDFAFEDIDNKERLKKDLGEIRTSNTFLMSLINDILDISKIDSGKMELYPLPYPNQEFISNIRSMFEPLCRQNGIKLVIDERKMNLNIVADHIRLNQIALNLLSNAVKYTPVGGTITYIGSCEKRADGKVDYVMEVRDTGIGISTDFQKKMFEPFTQEPSYTTRGTLKEKGTGLGLSIVRRIADLMGATIEVKSELGKGTDITVKFVFPQAADDTCESNSSSAGMTVFDKLNGCLLMAEDHPVNAEIAKRMLNGFGLEIVHVYSGDECLKTFEKSSVGEYKAILMDIQMPVMNGYEAAEKIRLLNRDDAKSIPIIAMTADAYAEDVKKCIDAGMNEHISKPLEKKRVYEVLKRFLKQ